MTMVFVISGILYVFCVGYYFMKKVDLWEEKKILLPASAKEQAESAPCRIILFGERAQTESLGKYFEEKKLITISTEDIAFQRDWKDVQYIIALSESDLDNLSFCNIGKRLYQLKKTFSVCNEAENKKLFAKNNIYVMDRKEIGQEKIYQLLTGTGA